MREKDNNKSAQKLLDVVKKRWYIPAAVVAVGVIVIVAMLANSAQNLVEEVSNIQKPGQGTTTNPNNSKTPVTSEKPAAETVKMPVAKPAEFTIAKPFYDVSASAQEQEKALVFYNNTFTENTGVDIVAKNKKAFDVTASLSGKVVNVSKDGLLGYVVAIEAKDGIITTYSSLSAVNVEKDMRVVQGQLLGTAGKSELNKDLAAHVHFEVKAKNTLVNPSVAFDKPSTALIAEPQKSTAVATEKKQPEAGNNKATDTKTNDQKQNVKSE
ncbi:MAG: peptidoglycan DD-metalloendopeptidase family protein [Bacilli bacterium]